MENEEAVEMQMLNRDQTDAEGSVYMYVGGENQLDNIDDGKAYILI